MKGDPVFELEESMSPKRPAPGGRCHALGRLHVGGVQRILSGALLLMMISGCAAQQVRTAEAPPNPIPADVVQVPIPEPSVPARGYRPPPQVPGGSLWSEGNTSMFQDIKARRVGDILTITVSEVSKASKSASTNTNRDKSMSGSMSFGGMTAGNKTVLDPVEFGGYDGTFGSGFKGAGSTSKADSMTAYMTATVVDVLPNGNLLIRGSRWTKVNNEMQQMILEGVVRPNDITRNNAVLSQNIADAKIFFEGKGPVTQQQKPGWLLQFFDLVSPF